MSFNKTKQDQHFDCNKMYNDRLGAEWLKSHVNKNYQGYWLKFS